MSDRLLLQGLAARRALTSQEDIDNAFDDPSACVQLFEEFVTEQYWGGCWADDTLGHRERSFLSLGMAAATGRPNDFVAALRTAISSGVTESEVRSAIRQIVLWCGIATGSECVRAFREVLDCTDPPPSRSARKRPQKSTAPTDARANATVLSVDLAETGQKTERPLSSYRV